MSSRDPITTSTGLLFGICSYLIWGFFPIYFRAIDLVPPPQVVAHRIVWAAFFLAILATVRRGWGDIRTALITRGSLLLLVTTALLIATNWLVFIIAVGHGEILQSSLGYFITPFVSVILGMTVLKERLRPMQTAALLLALVGVLLITLQQSGIPWAALTLAITFGSYGLLRKTTGVDAITGLSVETFLLFPAALAYLLFVKLKGTGCFLYTGLQNDILLVSAGLLTSIPLLLFAAAARRLRMATIGFLQYITPTMHFLIAVVIYREPFKLSSLVSFGFIWLGLLLYSLDALQGVRQRPSSACTD